MLCKKESSGSQKKLISASLKKLRKTYKIHTMDVFNMYASLGYQTPAETRRSARIGSRSRNYAPTAFPYSRPEPCKAESLKPFINPITKDVKDSWEPCSKRANKDDVLCPVHRRMLNTACAHGGSDQFKTNVRVPFEAISKGGCAMPAQSMAAALLTNGTPTAKTEGTKFFTGKSLTKLEINDRDQILNAFLIAYGA